MSAIILPRKKEEKRPKIGIIIQARMTSKRFPGKSMAMLAGKPVIKHVWEKAKQIRPHDMVILAVPDTPESDVLEKFVNNMGGILIRTLSEKCFRGNEDNVLERYYCCAKHHNLDIVVRITGDCPFLNPRVSSEVLQLLLWRKLDYTSNVFPIRTYPIGLDTEAFTFDCLEAAYISATSFYDKEHVTPWMQNTNGIKRGCTQQQINCSDQNWCIDYEEDIQYLEALIEDQQRQENGQQVMVTSVRG